MSKGKRNILLLMLVLIMQISTGAVYATYIEDIDTTDLSGYGLDSTFRITLDSVLKGQKLASYTRHGEAGPSGSFNYSFDEIKLAADSVSFDPAPDAYYGYFIFPKYTYCFVIKKSKDSSYYKIQVINKLPDNRYVFKYGANTTRNSRILEKPDYDRSIRYKPNNLYYRYTGDTKNRFSWEPPLPNNNHLLGYILYFQKKNTPIDTSAPINIAQWDSIGFTDSTQYYCFFKPHAEYFNIVAVYSEGKSEFLKGWTKLFVSSSAYNFSSPKDFRQFTIKRTTGGFFFELPGYAKALSFSIFSLTGQQVIHFNNGCSSHIFWNTSNYSLPQGLYIIRAQLVDRRVISQPFMFTR